MVKTNSTTGPVHILGPAVEALTNIERRLMVQDRLQAKAFLRRHGLHFKKADAVNDLKTLRWEKPCKS